MSARARYQPWFAEDPHLRYIRETRYMFWNLTRSPAAELTPKISPLRWIDDESSVKIVKDQSSPTGLAWLYPGALDWPAPTIITDLKDPREDE